MKTLTYQIAHNCEWLKTVNNTFLTQCEFQIDHYESMLPSGSGLDSGCTIDRGNSGKEGIIINFDFHHLNENGYYDGWTNHKAIIKPTLTGIELKVYGEDKNGIIEYLNDTLYSVLTSEVE